MESQVFKIDLHNTLPLFPRVLPRKCLKEDDSFLETTTFSEQTPMIKCMEREMRQVAISLFFKKGLFVKKVIPTLHNTGYLW